MSLCRAGPMPGEVRMSALVDGMVAGYGIAIPVGAISVLLVSLAMEKRAAGRLDRWHSHRLRRHVLCHHGGAGRHRRPRLPYTLSRSLLPLRERHHPHRLGRLWYDEVLREGGEGSVARAERGRIFLQFLALTALNPFTIVYFTGADHRQWGRVGLHDAGHGPLRRWEWDWHR